MFHYFWPIALAVISNVLYNITAKSTPERANPFLVIVCTYIVGAVLSTILYLVTMGEKSIGIHTEFQKLNWSSFAMGLSILGVEVGYIYMYRSGWNISIGSLISNVLLSVILVFVGVLIYKEQITWHQVAGIAMCLGGTFLMNKK